MSKNKSLIKLILDGDLDRRFVKMYCLANWVLMCLIVAFAFFFASSKLTAGILTGGVIANLNCLGLDRDCQRMLRWGTAAAYYGGLGVRLGLISLAVTVALLVFKEILSPVGMFVGLSVGVINFYFLVLAMVIHRFRYKEAA